MRRYRTSYYPQLERLEDWFAPNNLFALSDLGLADLPVPSTWAQPQPSRALRFNMPVLSKDIAPSGADVTLLGTRSSRFDAWVPVPAHLEHPRMILVTPKDALYLLNLPSDGLDRPAGPGIQGECPAITWNTWSGPAEDPYEVLSISSLPYTRIVPEPSSFVTTSIDVASPNYAEYPYVQDVDWTGWTEKPQCWHITEYYSPGVYGVRVNTISPPNNPYFLALQAGDAGSGGGRQQKLVGRQVQINEGMPHVYIASDPRGLPAVTVNAVQAIAGERAVPFYMVSAGGPGTDLKNSIDTEWRRNGMRPIDVVLVAAGEMPGGVFVIGGTVFEIYQNGDPQGTIAALGQNPNSAKGKVRSLTIMVNYLTRDYQSGMDQHVIKLMAQALDDGVTVNPRVGGWTGIVFAVRPGANRPGHFTSTEGSSFQFVFAR